MVNYVICKNCGLKRNIDTNPKCGNCIVIKTRKDNLRERYKNEDNIPDDLEDFIKTLPPEVFTKSRQRQVIIEKRRAVKILRRKFKLSFPKIAKILKYKDHTTPLYLYKTL